MKQKLESVKQKIREKAGILRIALLELVILVSLMLLLGGIVYLLSPGFYDNFESVESFQAMLERHSDTSGLIYIGVQAVQVMVSVIPGQIVQITGGYLYGFWAASLLSVLGVAAGSTGAFLLARLLGHRPIEKIFGESAVNEYTGMLNSNAAYRGIALLYLIPGFPKDILAYVAGLSRMKFRSFLPIATLVRYPSMALSMLIGAFLQQNRLRAAMVLVTLSIVMFGICFIARRPLTNFVDRYFARTGGGS